MIRIFVFVFVIIFINLASAKESYNIAKPGIIFWPKEVLFEKIKSSSCQFVPDNIENFIFPKFQKGSTKIDNFDSTLGNINNKLINAVCHTVSDNSFDALLLKNVIYDSLMNDKNLRHSQHFEYSDGKRWTNTDLNYIKSINLMPILYMWSLIQNQASANEINDVKKYFYDTLIKSGLENHDQGNHETITLNFVLAYAIVFNDEKIFNIAISKFKRHFVVNATDEGVIKRDSMRGSCAMHYNFHNINPMLGIIYNLNTQGIDITQQSIMKDKTILQVIDVILSIPNNPEILHKWSVRNVAGDTCDPNKGFSTAKSKNPKDIYFKTGYYGGAWQIFYVELFGDSHIEKFRNLPSIQGPINIWLSRLVKGHLNYTLGGFNWTN